MSKRFGRNQKRAMRADLSNARASLERKEKELAATRQSVRPMRDALDDVARVLGKHFIGLPTVEHYVNELQDRYRMPRATPADFLPLSDNHDMAMLVSIAMDYLEVGRMRSVVDELRGQIHVRFRLPDGELSYGISMSAMKSMRPVDWQRELAPIALSFGERLCARRAS